MNKLIIISGPTASGKTGTSIKLAKKIISDLNKNSVIVNFDSLLFYKEISIGTAKPTIDEMEGIEHFLVGTESISNPINAADYIHLAEKTINEQMSKNNIVILVGGSAFYLRALLKGMYNSISPDAKLTQELDQIYQTEGINYFINFLKETDSESFERLHHNDHYRIIRAVTHFKMTGTKISDELNLKAAECPYDLSRIIHPWDVIHFYLDLDKDQHFKIICNRTKKMFQDGLLGEIKNLKESGFSLKEKPLASIGYKESIDFLQGEFKTEAECIERISISTRQLAKSQRTFFKKITPKLPMNPLTDFDKIFELTKNFLN